jgi:hypothetical protein
MKKFLVFPVFLLVIALLFGVSSLAMAGGYQDDHSNNDLNGWTSFGGRGWAEKNGVMKPADASGQAGFLITQYPCANNGTFEATITADQWNGQNGGVVFRWTSAASFYFLAVKPGNEWNNAVIFCKDTLDTTQGTVLKQNFPLGTAFTLKIVMSGSHFDFYIDNVFIGGNDDTSHPEGRVGYAHSSYWNSSVSFDRSQWADAAGSTPPTVNVETVNDPANAKLKIWIKDEGYYEGNIIKPRIYAENIGTVIARNFKAYYLFKAEPGKEVVLEDYYTPDCEISLINLGNNEYAVEFYYTGKGVVPGDVTPDRNGWSIGIHYKDWSPQNKLDDPSNPGGSDWKSTEEVPTFGPQPKTPVTNTGNTGTTASSDGSITVNKLTVLNLHCTETEDTMGEDEARLHIYIDGAEADSVYNDINDGQDRSINREYVFTNSASFTLYDEDSPDGDDNLGSFDVDTSDGQHSGKFTGDGADYTLTYKVERIKIYPKKLTIITLRCLETEDNTGGDEARLEVYLDGIHSDTLKDDINDNQNFDINKTYDFKHGATLRLYDEDNSWIGDDDDFLGEVTINTAVGEHKGSFTLDDANYIITYRVDNAVAISSTNNNPPQIAGKPIVKEKQVKKLVVKTLTCNTTEDDTGADESYLDIFIDGQLFETVNKDLNDGDSFYINREYVFFSGAHFRLMDADTGVLWDDDDNLGEFDIDTTLGDHSGSFTGDGANYTITYTVGTTTIPETINSITDLLIYNFEQSTEEGVWTYINKTTFIKEIRARVANPVIVNQSDYPFCGPAAIIYCLAKKSPVRYAALCRDLFLTAQYKARTETITASGELRTCEPPTTLAQADWVAMASLRDDGNIIWHVTKDANDFVNGVTTPWEMEEWTFQLLGYNDTDYHTTFVYGELDALDDCRSAYDANGVGFLMIDTHLIEGTQNSFWESLFSGGYPKHWIVFEGDATINYGDWYSWDSGHVKFRYYSWADNTKYVDTDEGTFEDYMFGAVRGK